MGRWDVDSMTRVVKRPTKLKVLTQTYVIRWLNEDEWYAQRMGDDNLGLTERDKGLITLRADGTVDEDAMRSTLMHEILHTTTEAQRFGKYIKEAEDSEEYVVSQIAPVLLAVLAENPHVLAYLINTGGPIKAQ